MLMKFKIAVVQFCINQFNPKDNLRRAEKFIKTAALLNTQVIIFPEDFVTGPIFGKKEFADLNGKYIRSFQYFASLYKIDIIPGSIIEKTAKGLFNTAYYIDSKGKIKGRYRKINLWIPERKYLTPGNKISVFNTKFGKAGLIICWDLIFPEIFREMVKKGVKIVYIPSFWTKQDAGIGMKYSKDAELKNVNSLCTARAFENEIVLVYANAAGKLKVGKISYDLIGQSQITAPFKGNFRIFKHNREGMFLQDVNTDILSDAEKVYKIRKDLKNRLLH